MNLGPKLVVAGTFWGILILTVILLKFTAGLSYYSAAGDGVTNDQNSPMAEVSTVEQSLTSSQLAKGAEVSSGECAVSNRFPKSVLQWCDLITYYANKHNLDPDLVAAVVWLESGGDPVAYSHSGAVGLMQVMPSDGLASSFMCVNGPCFASRPTTEELKDPEFNLAYGTKLLGNLLNHSGDIREALKSYGPMNMGYYYADKVLGLLQQYGEQ